MYLTGNNRHPMEHDVMSYQDAMCNSQKPAPADPDKKSSEPMAADNYTGTKKELPDDPFGIGMYW